MRKVLLIVFGVFALAPSGASAAMTDRCQAPPEFEPVKFACSHTFTATSEPQKFQALGQDWKSYAARWIRDDGMQFVATGGHRPWCRIYGRSEELRVTENSCDGKLVVTVKSVGPPTVVTFSWEVY